MVAQTYRGPGTSSTGTSRYEWWMAEPGLYEPTEDYDVVSLYRVSEDLASLYQGPADAVASAKPKSTSTDERADIESPSASGSWWSSVVGQVILRSIERSDVMKQTWSDLEAAIQRGSDDDWGISYPTQEARSAAGTFLWEVFHRESLAEVRLLRPYDVGALPNEGLEFIWKADEQRIDIVFGPSGAISYLMVRETGGMPHMEEQHDVSEEGAAEKVLGVLGEP